MFLKYVTFTLQYAGVSSPASGCNILKAKIMGLIKEPKNVDLSTKSEPWTEQELIDFRKIMQDIKDKNAKRKERSLRLSTDKKQPA